MILIVAVLPCHLQKAKVYDDVSGLRILVDRCLETYYIMKLDLLIYNIFRVYFGIIFGITMSELNFSILVTESINYIFYL